MSKSRFFRVAVAGATASDGRVIEPEWLKDIAATYKPETYGARVNVEHIRGFTGDKPFKAMGDVLAVRTEEITLSIGGKDEKRLALFAQIEPHDDLVKLTKDGQKVFTSIEVAPNFGASGKAGLVGLAVTDSPASLGTERLAFTTGATAAAMKPIVDAFKTDPANILGASEETAIEIEGETSPDPVNSFFDEMKKRLFGTAASTAETDAAAAAKLAAASAAAGATAHAAGDDKVVALLTALKQDMDAGRLADQKAYAASLNEVKGQVQTLTGKLDTIPAAGFTQRQVATGGAGQVLTDC